MCSEMLSISSVKALDFANSGLHHKYLNGICLEHVVYAWGNPLVEGINEFRKSKQRSIAVKNDILQNM